MSQFLEHADAMQRELQQMHQQQQINKEKIEMMKNENAAQNKTIQSLVEQYQTNSQEMIKNQKIVERLQQVQNQYQQHLTGEFQMLFQTECEKVKQQSQAEAQASAMGGMLGMQMPAAAMMMAQAQQAAQAQAAQSHAARMMTAPSPRMNKSNGLANGIPGMQGMNGMSAMQSAMQNQMMAAQMTPAMAQQLQAMAAFGSMGAMGMPGMAFGPAQMAALHGMVGMHHPMMPPMSAANQAAVMAQAMAGGPHMNLSVSTPSRNHSNGPLSGTRTPQSHNSPRLPPIKAEEPAPVPVKDEIKEANTTQEKQISPTSDETVAVA